MALLPAGVCPRQDLSPYVLLWVVIYYLKSHPLCAGRGGRIFPTCLIGNLSSPFYYIVIVMVLSSHALWRWMVRHLSPFGHEPELAGDPLYAAAAPCSPFPYDRIFPTYLIFWTAGSAYGTVLSYPLPVQRMEPGAGRNRRCVLRGTGLLAVRHQSVIFNLTLSSCALTCLFLLFSPTRS